MEGLEAVRKELEAKRSQVAEALAATRKDASALEADLERIEAALSALSGKRAKKGSGRGRAKKPSASKEEVREVILEVRRAEPQAKGDALRDAVKAGIRKRGRALTGFGIVYPKALKDTS